MVESLKSDFNLTSQEICTVIAMELFVTPILEIIEVASNLMTDLSLGNTDLIRQISCDSGIMRYSIITTANHYPVLQAIFREIPSKED
ncbi:unnamed protein product, partial [Didymodactylos carnosus]